MYKFIINERVIYLQIPETVIKSINDKLCKSNYARLTGNIIRVLYSNFTICLSTQYNNVVDGAIIPDEIRWKDNYGLYIRDGKLFSLSVNTDSKFVHKEIPYLKMCVYRSEIPIEILEYSFESPKQIIFGGCDIVIKNENILFREDFGYKKAKLTINGRLIDNFSEFIECIKTLDK